MAGIPHDEYEANTKVEKWFDERLPFIRMIHDFVTIPTPKNLNWWWIWGIVLTFTLVLMIVTGVVLAMHYDVWEGFASIERIMRDVPAGYAFRYVHANGASLFFFAVYVHIFRGLFYGSYKAPREVTWIVGMIIYLLMMATAFLGYTLPQGQMSLHGGSVITGLFGAIPWIGPTIQGWLLGGPAMNADSFNRFYALHFLLPFIIAAMVMVHFWAFHTTGNNNPTGVEVRRKSKEEAKKDTVPFFPYFVVKDLVGLGIVLMVFTLFVWATPNYLGHPDNYIEMNRFQTPAHIVPEWYFLPFYAMLRAITFDVLFIDAKFMGVIVMFGSIFVMFFAPWLDRSKTRSGVYRPTFKWFFWGLVFDFIFLMWCGSMSPDDKLLGIGIPVWSIFGVIYWFGYFLVVLPVLGKTEKTRTPPETIEDDFNAHYADKA